MHDDDPSFDYSLSLFDQPLTEWTDDELRVGAFVVCERRDEAAAADPVHAERLNAVACVLADERDRRAVLARAVDEAMNPVQVVMPARILRTASERRRDRRHRG